MGGSEPIPLRLSGWTWATLALAGTAIIVGVAPDVWDLFTGGLPRIHVGSWTIAFDVDLLLHERLAIQASLGIAIVSWNWVRTAGYSLLLLFFLLAKRDLTRLVQEADDGPKCSRCGYDVRATSERCPECGLALEPLSTST